jgi:GntR family transcriptional regulator
MRTSGHGGNHDRVPRTPERPTERVEADLRRRVEAGEWASGEALPTVARLAEHYGVARGSVTRALQALEADGMVRVVPRWGTFRT